MPPNTPVFADVASRLRHTPTQAYGHGLLLLPPPSDMAAAAAPAPAFEHMVISTGRCIASTRPSKALSKTSRAISPPNVARPVSSGPIWNNGSGTSFARTYAQKPIAIRSPSTYKSDESQASASSTTDNAHRVTGFRQSLSAQEAMMLKSTAEQLQADLLKERDQREQFQRSVKSLEEKIKGVTSLSDRAAQEHAREIKVWKERYDHETKDLKEKHDRETKDLKARYYRETKDLKERYDRETKSLKDLSAEGLKQNEPVLEEARLEGEIRAKKEYETALLVKEKEFEEKLEATAVDSAAKNDAKWQDHMYKLERQSEREKQKLNEKVNTWSAKYNAMKRQHESSVEKARQADEQRKRTISDHADIKRTMNQALSSRKARALADRTSYLDYRELYEDMQKKLYGVLGMSVRKEEDLRKEQRAWRVAQQEFENERRLKTFRENSKYTAMKRKILQFLQSREEEASKAQRALRAATDDLKFARKAMGAIGHTSREVTRFHHFNAEQTPADAAHTLFRSVFFSPWLERRTEAMRELDEIKALVAETDESDVQALAELEAQNSAAKKYHRYVLSQLTYAKAFARREEMRALLHAEPIDQITFLHSHALEQELNKFAELMWEDMDSETRAPVSDHYNVSKEFREALQAMNYYRSKVRQRIVYAEELGLLNDQELVNAKRLVERLYAVAHVNERHAASILGGESGKLLPTLRARRRSMVSVRKSLVTGESTERTTRMKTKIKLRRSHNAAKLLPTTRRASRRTSAHETYASIATHRKRLTTLQKDLIKHQAQRVNTVGLEQEISDRMAKIKELQEVIRKGPKTVPESAAEDAEKRPKHLIMGAGLNMKPLIMEAGLNMKPSEPKQAFFSRSLYCHMSVRQFHASAGAARYSPAWETIADTLRSKPSDTQNASTGHNDAERQYPSEFEVNANLHHDNSPGEQTRLPQFAMSSTHGSAPVQDSSATMDGVDVVTESMLEEAQSAPEEESELPTILDFQIPAKAYRDAVLASPNSNAAFWSHTLYRSGTGRKVVIYYCQSLEIAEQRCQMLLGEPVLGFDLEWEANASLKTSGIKRNLSLIQIAAEDKICLVHIARFSGDKAEQLVPPSLKKILESPDVLKAGVNIGGDAKRLRICLHVQMKGVFELSHLYRLVKFGATEPKQVNFKLVNLAAQVQNVLLLPLKKDDVRVSAWSRPLNFQQSAYAAADAYAGYRLFNKLDNMRKEMNPTPPRPASFETWGPIVLGNGQRVERSSNKSRTTARKSAAAAVKEENEQNDEEVFDSGGELPPTYEPREQSTTVHTAVSRARADTAIEQESGGYPDLTSALADMHITDDSGTQDVTASSRSNENRALLSDLAEERFIADPRSSLVQAEDWAASYCLACEPAAPKVGHATLRAYHLWHFQRLSPKDVAASCRDPPLSIASVASHIMQALKEEELEYERGRLREVLACLPTSVWTAYEPWVEKSGMKVDG